MNEALQRQLAEMDNDALDRAYMEVFKAGLGPLVLEDLRNRCFVFTTTAGPDVLLNEGMRMVVLMIETRLRPIKTETQPEEK